MFRSNSAQVAPNKDSNARLALQDPESKGWTVPYVIEPSAGVDRGVLAVMNEAYRVETLENGSERTVMAFKPHLAPIKAAVLPLKRNHEGIVAKARAIKAQLQSLGLGRVLFDDRTLSANGAISCCPTPSVRSKRFICEMESSRRYRR